MKASGASSNPFSSFSFQILSIHFNSFQLLSIPFNSFPDPNMYLDIGLRASSKSFFRVPHLQMPMTVAELRKEFPAFAKEMDGSAKECTLRFFYKKDKESGIYEFIDADAEEEVAELMNVKVLEFCEEEEVDSDGEFVHSPVLTKEQMELHKEKLADIREGLEIMKKMDLNPLPAAD